MLYADWSVITKFGGVFHLMHINEVYIYLSVPATAGHPLSCCACEGELGFYIDYLLMPVMPLFIYVCDTYVCFLCLLMGQFSFIRQKCSSLLICTAISELYQIVAKE